MIHSQEAERSLIGAVLVDNDVFDGIAEIVSGEDFYSETHRLVWKAIEALAAAGSAIDTVMLAAALQPEVDRIGNPSGLLAECAEMVPAARFAAQRYAPIIRQCAVLRRLAEYGAQLARDAAVGAASAEAVEEMLAAAEYDLQQIASRQVRPQEKDWREVLKEELWRVEQREQQGIATGFGRLDQSYGGFAAGELTFLAARTSRGKTQIAMNFALNAARRGFPTAFFTLEMNLARIVLRTLSAAGLDLFRVRQRGYLPGERDRVEQAAREVAALPLGLLYRPSMRPRELRLECRRLVREMALKFAIVDYGGLMRGNQPERQRWMEMREVVLALKEIAGELNIPVLVLSQLNREVADSEEPDLAHLRDTGASEEHSSDVLMLWRPAGPGEVLHPDCWQPLKLKIAKQRQGPQGLVIDLEFRPSTGQFRCT